MKRFFPAAMIVSAGAAAFLILTPAIPNPPPARAPEPAPPTAPGIAVGSTNPTAQDHQSPQTALAELSHAIAGQDPAAAAAAARRLRDRLMAVPESLPILIKILTDPKADPRLRAAVAAILGSLPGDSGKRALALALRSGGASGIERAAILAIGIRELDDGEMFEREGLPYGMEIAPGLVASVRGPIPEGEIQTAVLEHLSETRAPELRRAAARVLRDSLESGDVRRAFLGLIGRDPDGETVAEAAAALASWTGSVPTGHPEREVILARILEVGPRSEEVVRFRLVGPVAAVRLPVGPAEQLRALTGHPAPEARLFAADVLARRLGRFPDEQSWTLPALVQAASADPDPEVREAAALGLGRAAGTPGVTEVLMAALRNDPDWEVRAAAAAALGRALESAAIRNALEGAASGDPRPEVRAAARRALASGGSR